MARVRRSSVVAGAALAFAFLCAHAVRAAVPTPEIGTTVVVKNQVMIEYEEDKRKLAKGNKVHQSEIVATSTSASAEIRLLDDTKLAVGPSARVVLDKFVYDPNAGPGSIAINVSKGAFRFITGNSPHGAYSINTPTAVVGVRGTVFDVFVADDGETAVLLHEGEVDVCPTPASCRRHNTVGRLVHVNLQHIMSAPMLWDGSIMHGMALGKAFPFVGKQLAIDPIKRLSATALLGKGGKASNIITKSVTKAPGGGKLPGGIDKVLPKFKLPF